MVVVEDDPAVLKALGRVLRAGGYEPLAFSSAEEFLSSSPRAVPLCFLLDVHLGGMSGLDLQRRLRHEGSSRPVILLTAFDDRHLRNQAARDGCLAYLSKDADLEVLLDLLRGLRS